MGWYVGPDGQVMEVTAVHTSNPKIVDLAKHNLGLAVVDVQYFEDEEDATDQSKANATDTIDRCNDLLDSYKKPKKKVTVPQGNNKSGWLGRKAKETDPLGPPEYGVGKFMSNRKSGAEYKIIGFRDDEEVLYILTGKTGTVRLTREALDRQFEVAE
jgi:hypothetical protein